MVRNQSKCSGGKDFFRTVGKSPEILEMSAALRWENKKLGFCVPFKAPYGSYVSWNHKTSSMKPKLHCFKRGLCFWASRSLGNFPFAWITVMEAAWPVLLKDSAEIDGAKETNPIAAFYILLYFVTDQKFTGIFFHSSEGSKETNLFILLFPKHPAGTSETQ